MKKYAGLFFLIVGAFIWGTAFAFQREGIFFVLLLFILVRRRADKDYGAKPVDPKKLLLSGAVCGTVLCIAMNLQQYGITVYPAQVSNIPGRSGFLTALYVVLVPIAGLFFKKKAHPLVYIAAILSVFSLWLLCLKNGFGGIYLGDILMLICAMGFTAQIIAVDTLGSGVDGVMLSCVQFLTAGVISLICALIFEEPTAPTTIVAAWLPILYVGVLSSGVAYTFQILGQKRTEPAFASVVMSLESVFAVLGGWVIFGDLLSAREICGCVCMFAAVLLAQSPQLIQTIRSKKCH